MNYYFNTENPFRSYTHALPATPGTLPPANAVRVESVFQDGFWPCEKNGAWELVEDHRGENGFVGGVETEIKELGPLPEGWSDTPPPPTEEEKNELRVAEIKSRLNEIDLESVRPLRAMAYGPPAPEDDAKLAALEQEAEALRQELAGLN